MPNLDDLFETPPAELITNLQALRAERAVIEGKEQLLEQLLEMLSQQGGERAERGNRTVTLDNVRITMKRMADADELVRPDPEAVLYGLADTQGVEAALERFTAVQQAQMQALQAVNRKGQPG
jgi:hypothetical protein